MACVDVPALPLQLLLKRSPGWASGPAAVVDRDRAQGVLLWVNGAARGCGVLPGMRYAAGLSLAGELRAGEVPEAEIRDGVALLAERLRRFTPDVEPAAAEPGVFWLGAGGLGRLWRSARQWARELRADLEGVGFTSRAAVGFSRFGTYAAARAGLGGGLALFRTPAEEERAARKIALRDLGLPPALRDALERLGVGTVGAFLALPADGVRERFGPGAHRLHRLASGRAWAPLEPAPAPEPLARRLDLDEPEADVYRLLFLVKRLLDPLLEALAARREALAALELRFSLDGPMGNGPGGSAGERVERLRSAAPTLDGRQLLNLVHLRLESAGLGAGVLGLVLTVEPAPATAAQLDLFAALGGASRRDPEAADRALARLRAELGEAAVVRAVLCEGHLPEARFRWEPLERMPRAEPRVAPARGSGRGRPLVRRLWARAVPLPPLGRHDPDGWLLAGEACGPVDEKTGPYIVSGGWWRRPVHREYHFARMRNGELFWIYYDRPRRRWFLHGAVE
ncbi:MAG: DNA polymerase Y family protein [Thermodesulfobacteriota bacterium]